MKKAIKIMGTILVSVLILNISVFYICRHGWRLFGFDMCENPDMLYIEQVYVTEDGVHIAGNTMSSASSYVGYTYEIKDNTLFLGIKQNLLFGFISRIGTYSVEIKDDLKNVEAICLLGGDNISKCIWSVQDADK
ncbi:MAG: hypothetical protein IJ297_05110 [Clostridia bacterium]|nr:hypothetical protein [Clostridia bacterium]